MISVLPSLMESSTSKANISAQIDQASEHSSTENHCINESGGKVNQAMVLEGDNCGEIGEQRKRDRRLAMNRITARERRRRKRQHLSDLENEVEKLTIMNETLQRMNADTRMQINQVAMAINALDPSAAASLTSLSTTPSLRQMIDQGPNQSSVTSLMINRNNLTAPALATTLPTAALQQQIQPNTNQNIDAANVMSILQGSQNSNLSSTLLQQLLRERQTHD